MTNARLRWLPAGLGAWMVGCAGMAPEPVAEACAVCEGACVEELAVATARAHVEGEVAYDPYPPSSGDHAACWTDWGVHTEAVPAENWVHNLEHGGVVFLYAPELTDVAALTTAVLALPVGRAVLTPAEEPMDAVVAVVAWEHRLLLGCYDEETLLDFFWLNVASAPEDTTSDPSASCEMDTGG